MSTYAVGLDIGGTRTKIGIANLETGEVLAMRVFPTGRDDESAYYQALAENLDACLAETGLKKEDMPGVGVSIGSYVFEDGTIDGMSCFVPYMKEGYPLVPKIEESLGLPVKADNDVRVISLAEDWFGAGRGYHRTMSITLGSGVGIGVCVGGKPFGTEAFCHLGGHVKVRTGGEIPALDEPACYCGIPGCFESTCSGTSLETYLRSVFGPEMTNVEFFQLAKQGDEKAMEVLNWYLDMLAQALNQYVYIYCPDVIILGGGVAKGLEPWLDQIQQSIVAKVHYKQYTKICLSELQEASGILGAACIFK